MCWKSETMLRDLPPDRPIEIWRDGRPCLRTTARQLMGDGRFPGFMFVDQVEFAFGSDTIRGRV